MIPPGIEVLRPGAAPGDAARAWLLEHGDAAELPSPYIADNALTRHVQAALSFAALELSAREHVNQTTGTEFRCVSYIADDAFAAAYCTRFEDTYLTVVGNAWLFRLVKICDRLRGALAHRPRRESQAAGVARDDELTDLLWGNQEVTEAEAIELARAWSAPLQRCTDADLGVLAVFYDLVRLVWIHEWTHALFGHVDFGRAESKFMKLYESSKKRATTGSFGSLEFPTAEVMQSLEMQADEFAVRYSLVEILYGNDPASDIAGPRIDLVDRLLYLNTAFCVFALVWALDEIKGFTGSVPWTARTHPPVGLRYDRFRGFERQEALGYDAQLMTAVDASSIGFLHGALTDASGVFGSLLVWTPFLFRTPAMDDLEKYEGYLMRIEPSLAEALGQYVFLPTRGLRASDAL